MLKDQELIVGKKNVIQLLENLMPAKGRICFFRTNKTKNQRCYELVNTYMK